MKTNIIVRTVVLASIFLAATVNSYGQADTLKEVKPYVSDVRELLTGQTPGVITVSSMGSPGMTPTVYVRGIHIYNEYPAFYVDGVMVRDLGLIAPESIEKIEVLSGAEAVMRFGPAAANGALAVTTRKASRPGFHASYSFTGAMHQLAWEPKQITHDEWRKYWPGTADFPQNNSLLNRYNNSFAQTHSLNLQYGGDKLSIATAFDFLDNDGPLDGRKDSQRRFSGSARVEYRPLDWLRLELSGAAGKSNSAYLDILPTILYNRTMDQQDYIANQDRKTYHDGITGQALIEVKPVNGLSIKGYYGLSKENSDSYGVGWNKEYNYFNVGNSDFYTWDWNQFGLDADYAYSSGKNSLSFGLAAKRQNYDYFNIFYLNSQKNPNDYGISWGDYEAVKTKFLDPIISKIAKGEMAEGANYTSFRRTDSMTDLSFRVNYDWNHKLSAGFGIYQRWRKNKVAQIKQPSLAANVRWDSGQNWALFGSWGQTYSVYQNNTFSSIPFVHPAEYSRMDAGGEICFPFGQNRLDLRVLGFFDKDSYKVEDSGLSVRNEGIETSADWAGQSGFLRYAAGASLTLYRNKVLSMYKNVLAFRYRESLEVRESYPVGIAWLKPMENFNPENGSFDLGDMQALGNGLFPKASLGLHGSLAWNNWQFSVSGHGNFGQTILHSWEKDALARHYLENSWTEDNKKALYPPYGYYQSVCESSAGLHCGSFFRIDQIRLDYTLPVKRFHSYINLFLSMENYFLFSSYPGSDPELLLYWDTAGIEEADYPSTKRIVTGLKISF